MEKMQDIILFIREIFNESTKLIPLHAPTFIGNEKKYLIETIESTYVSSVGEFVNRFEEELAKYVGAKYAVACVNGTNALQVALMLANVKPQEEVLTQAFTFVATANAISYLGASPLFIDIDKDTLGMSPAALSDFLMKNVERRLDGFSYNKCTGKKISACVPMHTFGFPLRIDEVAAICKEWNILLIEDAAESLGSYYQDIHTGNFGVMGVFSFNGNKIITSGGGGALVTNNEKLARRAKHITTQAKLPHAWRFTHDEIGFNFRLPNLNAALLCAQIEQLDFFLEKKRELSNIYEDYFSTLGISFIKEIENAKANYWLNAILLDSENERDEFLKETNKNGIMTRPAWDLMNTLPMFKNCQSDELQNSRFVAERLVNIPSSVIVK